MRLAFSSSTATYFATGPFRSLIGRVAVIPLRTTPVKWWERRLSIIEPCESRTYGWPFVDQCMKCWTLEGSDNCGNRPTVRLRYFLKSFFLDSCLGEFFPFGEQDKAFVLWNIDSSDKETFRKEGLHPFPHVPCLVVLLFRGATSVVFFCPKPPSEALYLTVSSFQNNGLVRWPRSEMGSHSYWFDLEKRRKELPSLGLSKISIVLLCGKVWVHHLDWSTCYLRRETLVQLQKECDLELRALECFIPEVLTPSSVMVWLHRLGWCAWRNLDAKFEIFGFWNVFSSFFNIETFVLEPERRGLDKWALL